MLRFLAMPLIGLALAACVAEAPDTPRSVVIERDRFSGPVERVVDGDTFRMVGLNTSVRIWGLDAPERSERAGPLATATLRRLIGGQVVSCRLRDIDRYKRAVGQCFLPDGRDIAATMIALGVATEYCRYSRGAYRTC